MPQIIGFANTRTPAEKNKRNETASQETLSYLQTKIVT